jgi:hypothetical protein
MSTLRISLWPGSVVPIPPVVRVDATLSEDLQIVLIGGALSAVKLPEEFVLRQLLDLDVQAHAEADMYMDVLLDFVATYGVPLTERSSSVELEHLAEGVRSLQDLVRLWVSLVELPEDAELDVADVERLVRRLNEGLLRLHPSATLDGRTPAVDLRAACHLQLHNLMVEVAEGVPLRRCQNERCGRAFLRQYDMTARTKHRVKGLRFCSLRCARNQAKREFHRRQKESD